jgi:DNA-binding NarL/FixJ family response regulator
MSKTRVLIVDDCMVVRDGLRSLLKGCPCIEVVGEAVGGREAIAKAGKLQPDVVLMDAQMPDLDGAEATRHIKERWPHIKVLFLTVHSSYIEAAVAAGADSHLMKDCTRQELLGAIGEVSGQKPSKCA